MTQKLTFLYFIYILILQKNSRLSVFGIYRLIYLMFYLVIFSDNFAVNFDKINV